MTKSEKKLFHLVADVITWANEANIRLDLGPTDEDVKFLYHELKRIVNVIHSDKKKQIMNSDDEQDNAV